MLRKPALMLTLAALAAGALVPVVHAATAPPRLTGTPTATFAINSNSSNGRFVTIGAVVHLDRRFANSAEQRHYAVVAGTSLHPGQVLPDATFGGTAIGRFTRRPGAWYSAEAVQLRKHSSAANGDRWEIALARDGRIVGAIKHVTLRRG